MFLRIETIQPKKLIGFSTPTTLADDKTVSIWKQLMPRLKEVKNAVSADLISLQVYDFESLQDDFTPFTEFTKHALVEVKNFDYVPEGFETFELPAGEYAVFLHKGIPADFAITSQYIFGEWMPASNYNVDNRPHFEILGDLYINNHPDSQEEVWIPIKNR